MNASGNPSADGHISMQDLLQHLRVRQLRIVQDVTVARTAPRGGSIAVSGTLRYQACDDSLCYPPRNVPVTWTVPIR